MLQYMFTCCYKLLLTITTVSSSFVQYYEAHSDSHDDGYCCDEVPINTGTSSLLMLLPASLADRCAVIGRAAR